MLFKLNHHILMNFQNKYLKSHAKIFANLSTVAKFQFLPQQRDVEKRQTLTTMTESQIIKISFALSHCIISRDKMFDAKNFIGRRSLAEVEWNGISL